MPSTRRARSSGDAAPTSKFPAAATPISLASWTKRDCLSSSVAPPISGDCPISGGLYDVFSRFSTVALLSVSYTANTPCKQKASKRRVTRARAALTAASAARSPRWPSGNPSAAAMRATALVAYSVLAAACLACRSRSVSRATLLSIVVADSMAAGALLSGEGASAREMRATPVRATLPLSGSAAGLRAAFPSFLAGSFMAAFRAAIRAGAETRQDAVARCPCRLRGMCIIFELCTKPTPLIQNHFSCAQMTCIISP